MTREDQAGSLGRWLERVPGSAPPDDLEADVIEAVYALRPDLAPAPRLTADDILASVTRGPLAGAASTGASSERPDQGAEVVPFPVRRTAVDPARDDVRDSNGETRPTPPGRRGLLWMWVGGTGGLGMALVAAATMLLVATPVLRDAAERQAETQGSPAASSAPAMQAPAEDATVSADAASPALPEASSVERDDLAAGVVADETRARAAASGEGGAAKPNTGEVATGQVFDMENGALYREPTVIAEAEEQRPVGAVAAAPSPATEDLAKSVRFADELPAADAGDELDTLRQKVATKGRDSSGWRKLVDADVLARMDAGIAQAEALRATGSYQAAGDALSAVVQPPARAGQYLATLAARDYLAAGNAQAASGVAQRGIGLSSQDSAERSALLLVYGDALRALGDTEAAADMYRQAK